MDMLFMTKRVVNGCPERKEHISARPCAEMANWQADIARTRTTLLPTGQAKNTRKVLFGEKIFICALSNHAEYPLERLPRRRSLSKPTGPNTHVTASTMTSTFNIWPQSGTRCPAIQCARISASWATRGMTSRCAPRKSSRNGCRAARRRRLTKRSRTPGWDTRSYLCRLPTRTCRLRFLGCGRGAVQISMLPVSPSFLTFLALALTRTTDCKP